MNGGGEATAQPFNPFEIGPELRVVLKSEARSEEKGELKPALAPAARCSVLMQSDANSFDLRAETRICRPLTPLMPVLMP